jgi:hypothetical protein
MHQANSERRARLDRRLRDAGPPAGWRDRRRSRERRLPEMHEETVSESEWEMYFGRYHQVNPDGSVVHATHLSTTVVTTIVSTSSSDEAADIFDRHRRD